MTRVLVTGLGPVSSIGIGAADFWSALQQGRSGAGPVSSFDTAGFPRTYAAEVPGFRPEEHLNVLKATEWGRSSLFAAAAANLALTDAGLDASRVDPLRCHVAIGTTSGESQVLESLTATALHDGGLAAVHADEYTQLPATRLSNAVSAETGFEGESVTIATACSASNYAIGYGYDLIKNGEADLVLAGGADSVCRWAHAGFFRLGALAEDKCRPFDADREGILTGEGGAVVLLESSAHAASRGVTGYAEVLGYGTNCDARHPVSPDRDAIASCMTQAHKNAGIEHHEVDYICAHGTGTHANDLTEAQAIRDVFAAPPPTSSIKSMIGHTMGAASGFGAIASALAVTHNILPPTINWATPDPEFDWIDPVPAARDATVNIAQNDGFAFGGNNAIVILGSPA